MHPNGPMQTSLNMVAYIGIYEQIGEDSYTLNSPLHKYTHIVYPYELYMYHDIWSYLIC